MGVTMGDFGAVGNAYQEYSEGIRGRIRHELVFGTLAKFLRPQSTVMDMGCGDGEITLRLARAGHTVVGVDVSAEMLERAQTRLRNEPDQVRGRASFQQGDIEGFPADRDFDAVCCHGVLMYLADSDAAVAKLAAFVAPGGLLSILTRNSLAAGAREALRGDYAAALEQVLQADGVSVGNLGIATRGDDPWHVQRTMELAGMSDCSWYGIRVFSDHLETHEMEAERFDQLLALEAAVSHRDPYRSLGRLFHAMAFRSRFA